MRSSSGHHDNRLLDDVAHEPARISIGGIGLGIAAAAGASDHQRMRSPGRGGKAICHCRKLYLPSSLASWACCQLLSLPLEKSTRDTPVSPPNAMPRVSVGAPAPGSPWQNGFAERLIGSIRRECVDHIVVLGEAHLRRTVRSYARYYNEWRVHRSLNKDAPFHRAIERLGTITSTPILGGLHHHYCRI
jgi:Integrase core domain